MESFYGGRQGASFVIKKSFKYINKQDPAYIEDLKVIGDVSKLAPDLMEENLSNPNYKDVWYNEYCIIDTTNKNNPRNGEIYRRTLQIQGGEGDISSPYEYIGQIVGPSAGVPMLNIRPNLLTPTELQKDLSGDWDGLGWEDDEGKVLYDPSVSLWPKEYSATTIKTALEQLEEDGISGIPKTESFKLVPGYDPEKTGDERYNDTIKYNWYNVRKNTKNNAGVVESWCYIGMKIPYTVFTVSAISVGPKEPPSVEENAKADGSSGHPFWYDFIFEIPRGLPGVSVQRIWKGTLSDKDLNENIYYDATNPSFSLTYNSTNNTYSWNDITPESLTKDKPYWLAELLIEQMNETKTIKLYLGDVVEINGMYINENKTQLRYTDTSGKNYLVGDLWYPEFKPYSTTAATIEEALEAMPTDGSLAKGHVYAVSPTNDESSYLVVWDGDEKKWIQLCVTGSGGGIPAQIQKDDGSFTYKDNAKAKGCIKFSNIDIETGDDSNPNKPSLPYFWS